MTPPSLPSPLPPAGQDEAISHCYATLTRLGVTGRLRVGREGFNATLTGSREGVRAFTQDLRVREAGESVRVRGCERGTGGGGGDRGG